MEVKWKIASPDDFFNEMSPSKFKIDEGVVKPRSYEGIMWLYILDELISFEGDIDHADKMEIIRESLMNSLKVKFDSNYFFDEIKKNLKRYRKKVMEQKTLLTSISLGFSGKIKEFEIFNSKINIYNKEYPKQYYSLFPHLRDCLLKEEQHYSKISVTQKTYHNEPTHFLRLLNIFRAVLCLHGNQYMVLGNKFYEPINYIKLGKSYFLYNQERIIGHGSEHEYKYCPQKGNFTSSNLNEPLEMINIIGNIRNEKYKIILQESLLIFVNALDDSNPNAALALLWNSLDKLTNSSKGNYDQVLKRVASIGTNYSYDMVVLENIKNIRNEYVHLGIENPKAKIFCYQLQSYFKEILKFHVKNCNTFSDIQEANDFLTYISKLNELKGDKQNINKIKIALPHQRGIVIRGK